MKKKNLKLLKLNKKSISNFEQISGGALTAVTCYAETKTDFLRCSIVVCYTNVNCGVTQKCNPIQTVTNNTVNEACYTDSDC